MKNLFIIGAWLCGIASAVLLVLGFSAILSHERLFGNLGSTYYYLSSNIILAGIMLLLFYIVYKGKKE
jgi:hypothetical protein